MDEEDYRPIDAINERLESNFEEGEAPKQVPPPAKLPESLSVDGPTAEPQPVNLQSEKPAEVPASESIRYTVDNLSSPETSTRSEWGPLNDNPVVKESPVQSRESIDFTPLLEAVKTVGEQIRGLRDDLSRQKPVETQAGQSVPQPQIAPGFSPEQSGQVEQPISRERVRRPRGWLKKPRRKKIQVLPHSAGTSGYSQAVIPEQPEPVLPKVSSVSTPEKSIQTKAELPGSQRYTQQSPVPASFEASQSSGVEIQGRQQAQNAYRPQPVQRSMQYSPEPAQQQQGTTGQQDPATETQKSVQSIQHTMAAFMKVVGQCVSVIQEVAQTADGHSTRLSQVESQLQGLMQFAQSTRQRSMRNGHG